MSKQLLLLSIADILTDKGTQSRVTLSQSAIKDYTTDIKNAIALDGEHKLEELRKTAPDTKPEDLAFDEDAFLTEVNPFPPVEVFRDAEGHIYLVDGFHRVNANKGAGLKQVLADVKEGTLRDALLYSVSVNKSHGVMRTQKDKRRAVEILLADEEWKGRANNWIAEIAGVSEFLVRQMRPAVDGGDGTKIVRTRGGGTAKAAKKGTKKKGASGSGNKGTEKKGPDEKTLKLIDKIEKNVEGEMGAAIKKAIIAGTLPLTTSQLRDFAGFSSKVAKTIAPLIATKKFPSPRKAFEFVKGAINNKLMTELELRAIANGGSFEHEHNGFYLMFFSTRDFTGEIKAKAAAKAKK